MPMGIYKHPPQCGFQKGNKLGLGKHYALGYRHTTEAKEKISIAGRGRKISSETRKRMVEASIKRCQENPPTAKQLNALTKGRERALNSLRKNHPDFSGKKNPFYGKNHTLETKLKISKANSGWHHTKEIKQIISECQLGEKHWNWKGGISKIKYGIGWTNVLKESIRLRDNYKCRICGISQEECDRSLCVHHADDDKKNLNPNNLISLCDSCHVKLHNNENFKKETEPLCLN